MRGMLVAAAALAASACASGAEAPREIACHSGLYATEAGELLVLTPVLGEAALRWTRPDGRTGRIAPRGAEWISTRGWTEARDGMSAALGACGAGRVRLGSDEFARVALARMDTHFVGAQGVRLAGTLLAPAGAEPVPLVVLVHGSNRESARRYDEMPAMLAGLGVAAFVYDKRGSGGSEGRYTQDFDVLAEDARAALAEARRLLGPRTQSAGYLGRSQGGWIAPLAARDAPADFIVALYGAAYGPLYEDRAEVVQGLAAAGWGEDVQAKGAALSDAAGAIMASRFREGYGALDALRARYRREPWFDDVAGEYTGEMLRYPSWLIALFGPTRNQGTSWRYEPMPTLRALAIPQLWMLARADTEAPIAETHLRLLQLQREGKPIDLAIYPDAEHGMRQLDGEGRPVGRVPDYYRTLAAWISGRELAGAEAAGAAVIRGP